MENVMEGWLNKAQSEKKFLRPKTTTQKSSQRWFVLKQSNDIPGQYYLEYYTDSTCKKQKGRIDLDQCKKINRKIDPFKPNEFLFSIETAKRTFNLLTHDKEELNKWIQCLCTVCGFRSNQPNQDKQTPLQDQSKDKQNNIIVISYSNPNTNLSLDNCSSNQSPTNSIKRLLDKSPVRYHLNNETTSITFKDNKTDKILVNSDLTKKWINNSNTLNRSSNRLKSPSTFTSLTLPKKINSSSAYIPIRNINYFQLSNLISECHTGKSIFDNNDKKKDCFDQIVNKSNDKSINNKKFETDFNDDDQNLKHQISSDSNKENKFTKNLLDISIDSTKDLPLLDLNKSSNSSSGNFDCNYDIPKQIKIHKKSKIKDLLNIVPSPPKEETLYENYCNLNNDERTSNNLVNYTNILERKHSLNDKSNEREYYNRINNLLNNSKKTDLNSTVNLPPPRPPKPTTIISKQKSTSLNSLNNEQQNKSDDLDEFDPISKQLNSIPKVPTILATSPDFMYSIPKSQIELETERQLNRSKNSLDTIVPLTHNSTLTNKDELHRYTNAAPEIFKKSPNGQLIINDYENPTLPCNNLNDKDYEQFKIPTFKLDPMTPSLIVTSTPLFLDQNERHFNFNQNETPDELNFMKPQVNRDLKPKKSDTSIESFLIYTNKSPNKNSDTLIQRTNLNSSFNKQSSILNPPKVPSRGRQYGNKFVTTNPINKIKNDLIYEDGKNKNKKFSDYTEIQYLDLDLDGDNISLNSTNNDISINSNFKDTDLLNSSCLNNTTLQFNQQQQNNLNNSFNTNTSTLNYSHFNFSNKLDNQFNTLNNSFTTNPSTVYKTVDFVATKAFNELKKENNLRSRE